jgi:hypothetical protein
MDDAKRWRLQDAIKRLRRTMPRNGDVIAVCEAAEAFMISAKRPMSRAEIQRNYRLRKKAAKEQTK